MTPWKKIPFFFCVQLHRGNKKTTPFLECWCIFGICQYTHLFQPQTAAQDGIWWKWWWERLHFILMRWGKVKSEGWREGKGGMRDLLFSWISSFYWCAQYRYFKTYSKDTQIQVFHVCCVCIFCPCLRGFSPAPLGSPHRCSEILNYPEVRVKGVCPGKPHPECISVSCQVTAGMDFWNTAPPDRRHQW